MPTISITHHLHHPAVQPSQAPSPPHLLVTLAAAAALTAPSIGAAAAGGGRRHHCATSSCSSPAAKERSPTNCPSASTVPPAPAAGSFRPHRGTPIRSGTFFAAIDNGQAAPPRRCVPATLSGLLYETPDDAITQVGDGTVCPNGAGGHVITGLVDIAGVSGRFRDVSSGHGRPDHHRRERLRHPHPHLPHPYRLAESTAHHIAAHRR